MRLRIPHVAFAVLIVLGLFGSGIDARVAGAAEAERFADVDPLRFFGDAVEWAHGAGVVQGITPACFAPDRTASRAEVAAVLHRLLAPEAEATTHGFVDVRSTWQQVPVAWMASLGITTGRTPERFAPNEAVTRGELLTFVWRWQCAPDPPVGLVAPEPTDCLVATGTCADMFPAAVVAEIGAVAAGRRVTAHVHDQRTDCIYELNPGLELTTASVIKAQVLAGVLLAAQDRGQRCPRPTMTAFG